MSHGVSVYYKARELVGYLVMSRGGGWSLVVTVDLKLSVVVIQLSKKLSDI